mmetsp:Transcript_84126/g.238575  ORF Transcript_84126/g.238575 Transcript_84126/m.238575 type:complete len:91 (+) Transcript_84126:1210-1482(+)
MMTASCLVNPLSGYETELKLEPVAPENKIKVAVVGGGCAGLAASCAAAERGHDVTLFEASQEIGGQVGAHTNVKCCANGVVVLRTGALLI